MTRSSAVATGFLVAAATVSVDCAPALVTVVSTIPHPPVSARTREPPRRPGIDSGVWLGDGERQRIATLQRVRAPGAAAMHCPTAYAEDFAGDGLFYFAGCDRVVVLECRAFAPDGRMACRVPGSAWPAPIVTTELAAEHIQD